jgi:signal transduction histidine kinase
MKRPSLRLRLLGGAAITIFIALALSWAGLSWLFHQHVEAREAAALVRVGETVAAGLALDAKDDPTVSPAPSDARFLRPASGVYWQAQAAGGTAQSASLWDQNLPAAHAGAGSWSRSKAPGPFGRELLMVARRIQPDTGRGSVTIVVATDDADMRETYREFDRELAIGLGLLWLVLSGAAYAQVSLGLAPLEQVRAELERLRRNPSARLPPDHPREIAPLVEAINALAHAREDDLGRARRRAGDLAHSLKTPLAVLAAQSRRARESGAEAAADGLDRAIAAMGAALETELARARAAAARNALAHADASPAEAAEQLIAVVERTEKGEAIVFAVDVDPALRAPLAAADLAEVLGALIENAARHARRQVRVTGAHDGEEISVTVEDDGPGMDPGLAAAATVRGARLDESGNGHGLGLAIVRDLMEATDGSLSLGRSELGGLSARLSWRTA